MIPLCWYLLVVLCVPAVIAETRPIGKDLKAQIDKSLALLRDPMHDLGRAADWLESWVNNDLPPCPLLRVDSFLKWLYSAVFYLFFLVRLLFPSPEISIVLGVRLMVKSGPFSADGRPELQSADPLTVGENQIKLLVCCLISWRVA